MNGKADIWQQLSVDYLVFFFFSCMFNTSLVHIRSSFFDVCFIIFVWSCLFWIKMRKIAKNGLIKNRSKIRLKVYKKLVVFMKNWL